MVQIMNGINRLDIKQLRVLHALLDLKNLSQVARKMGLTPVSYTHLTLPTILRV